VKRGKFALASGEEANIGRRLARSTVRRTTILVKIILALITAA